MSHEERYSKIKESLREKDSVEALAIECVIEKLEDMHSKQKDIYFVIVGNEKLKQPGIVDKLEAHEKRIASLESHRWIVIGGLIVIQVILNIVF